MGHFSVPLFPDFPDAGRVIWQVAYLGGGIVVWFYHHILSAGTAGSLNSSRKTVFPDLQAGRVIPYRADIRRALEKRHPDTEKNGQKGEASALVCADWNPERSINVAGERQCDGR